MPEYSTEPFLLVSNSHYDFHKLLIDGQCRFDEFYAAVRQSKTDSDSFDKIISMMDDFCPHILLPKTKFRQIKDVGRNDVFEFKHNNIRLYVIKQQPDIYVVIGGSKSKQDKIIRWLKKALRGFNTQPHQS